MQDELTRAIAVDLGIADMPPSEQQELIAQFGEVALKAATLAVAGSLTEGKRAEFARLSGAGDVTALKSFLDQEIPDHEEIAKRAVTEEITRFKQFQTQGTGSAA